jgi:hypothetical protein
VGRGLVVKARDEGPEGGVGPHPGGVEEELVAPDELGLLAEVDDPLEEAFEDRETESSADAGQAGVVGEVFIERVAEGPSGGRG